MQDAFQPIPGLINCAGVTGRWGLLSYAQNDRSKVYMIYSGRFLLFYLGWSNGSSESEKVQRVWQNLVMQVSTFCVVYQHTYVLEIAVTDIPMY